MDETFTLEDSFDLADAVYLATLIIAEASESLEVTEDEGELVYRPLVGSAA